MTRVETYGEIKDGELHIVRRKDFVQSLKSMPNCRVIVTVAKAYKKRSDAQNMYYWGCVINDFVTGFRDSTGQQITTAEAHELLKMNANFIEITNETTGEMLKVGRSTAKLSTVEMEEYLDRCRRFIFEWFNITVLLPGEQASIELIFNKEED